MKTKHQLNSHLKSSDAFVTYVFQGGGALGSFQVGAYEALSSRGYAPDMLVGISIGAINASIIAGNPIESRTEKLHQFWQQIGTKMPFSALTHLGLSKFHHFISASCSLLHGQHGFFYPRVYNPWLLPDANISQLSFYDTSPLKKTLLNLIDFDYLNRKGPRLCLGAVDLGSGDFEFFDSLVTTITPEHIMASCALPPGFPPVQIDDRYYVDGGVYSNTPLSRVLDEFADSKNDIKHVLCFMVDLFSSSGALPHSMDGLLERTKDIQYSSHSKRSSQMYATTQNLSHAINLLASKLTKEQLADPEIQKIINLGYAHRLDIVRVVYHSEKGSELHSKDYEFSCESANTHRRMGYTQTIKLIDSEEHLWTKSKTEGVRIYTLDEQVSTKKL